MVQRDADQGQSEAGDGKTYAKDVQVLRKAASEVRKSGVLRATALTLAPSLIPSAKLFPSCSKKTRLVSASAVALESANRRASAKPSFSKLPRRHHSGYQPRRAGLFGAKEPASQDEIERDLLAGRTLEQRCNHGGNEPPLNFRIAQLRSYRSRAPDHML